MHPSASRFFLSELSLDDLALWAGEAVFQRGLSYHKAGRACDVAMTHEGRLVATVYGTQKYATLIFQDTEGELASICTCPYGSHCKHAVAVACAGLDLLAAGASIPLVAAGDKRLLDIDITIFPDENALERPPSRKELEAALKKLSKGQLIALALKAAVLAPQVAELYVRRAEPTHKDVLALVKDVRKALLKAQEMPNWEEDDWRVPDYGPVRTKLEALRQAGFAAETLDLGLELIENSVRQIEICDDEGELQDDVAQCMPIVLQALYDVDWPAHKKLLWAVEALLADEFSVSECFEGILNEKRPPEEWNPVADALSRRLADYKGNNYSRDRIRNMTVRSLSAAGREAEIFDLYKKEALHSGKYARLVKYLLDKKNDHAAEEWIHKGLAAMEGKNFGEVEQLRSCLLELRKRQKDWDAALCLEVENFVFRASLRQFKECRYYGEKLKVWPILRPLLMDFLTTGAIPWLQNTWPCRNRGRVSAPKGEKRPDFNNLIDLAIYEKKPAEVLNWYDLQCKTRRGFGYDADSVATAVRDFAPDRALALWRKLAEAQIARVSPSAYVEAAAFLRKMGKLMRERDMAEQWNAYIQSLRIEHRRKTRLMETLDSLYTGVNRAV